MSGKDKEKKVKVDHFIEDKNDKVETDVDGVKDVIDFNKLKSGGFVKQKQKDLFTVRCACPGGRVPVEKLKKMTEAAEKYGNGYVHLSVRQSLEIPYVNYKDFNHLVEILGEADAKVATCGPRVRVPTACSGCEYNPNGLSETQKMAEMVYKKFFAHQCNHKFKMSFSGCPFDCVRTNTMDLGFQGAVVPRFDNDKCIACKICSYACKEGAIKADEEGRPVYIEQNCFNCGDCIRACPTEAWLEDKKGHIVRVGGKHGRHPLSGAVVAKFLPDSLVATVVEKTLHWYNKAGEGKGRIRIGDFLRNGRIKDYMESMKDVFGPYAVKNPREPEPIKTI